MNRTRRSLRLLTVATAVLSALAVVPALASANRLTVDDNRTECPVADYTTLTEAVAKAANGDTIHVCAGTYYVPSGSPSSGLKIEKNLTIEGAGASKVFVQPAAEPGTSLAQAAPNPRDEYGNIITVRRRLIELYEVSISGLTVRANNIPVEAGIAMIDVDRGSISGVKVEGLVPSGGPGTGAYAPGEPLATQGQGIIVANTIEATDDVTTITGSEVKGFNATGVLVDNRSLAGTGSVGNDSHVTAKVINTKITGAGGTPAVAQNGVEGWGSGARVQISKSKVAAVGKADGTAAAVALHGVDVGGSIVGGSDESADNLTENAYGITNVAYGGEAATTVLDAGHNFWGTTVASGTPLVGPEVEYLPALVTAPTEPTLAAVVDSAPTMQWDDRPDPGSAVTPGQPVNLAAVAEDDFGVTKVEFRFAGTLIGTAPTPMLTGERLYSVTWTPSAEQYGANRVITAVATDSGGLTSEITTTVNIAGPPRLSAMAGTIVGKSAGFAVVGKPLICEAGDASYPAASIAYEWTSGGTLVGTASSYTPTAPDQAKRIACTVTATNAYGSVSQSGGQVLVASGPVLSAATLSGYSGAYALAGQTLTCKATAGGEPEPTVSYAWLRDGSPIAGASSDVYTLGAEDETHVITCAVTASSVAGSITRSAAVGGGGSPRGGQPTISGSGKVGSELTCGPGSWTALPAAQLATVWLRGGQPIEGATGASYTPSAAEAGSTIACRVTASNELGSVEATSATVTVEAAPPLVNERAKGTLKGAKVILGTVVCDVGPCQVTVPAKVKLKIGGKTYRLTVIAPAMLGSGESGTVSLRLGKVAREALKRAGVSAKIKVLVTVNGGGGSTTTKLEMKLFASAKR